MENSHNAKPAFTLVELLIVVMILGILAAVVIPQFSDAVEDTEEAAVLSDLAIMREAIQRYALEHKGNFPNVLTALVKYSSEAGAISSNKTAVYKLGPYLKMIPPCPSGPYKGQTGWGAANANPPTVMNTSGTVGWLYHWTTGGVWPNDSDYFDK